MSFLKSFLFQLTRIGFPGLQLRTLTDIEGDLKGELSMRVRYSVACTTRQVVVPLSEMGTQKLLQV